MHEYAHQSSAEISRQAAERYAVMAAVAERRVEARRARSVGRMVSRARAAVASAV